MSPKTFCLTDELHRYLVAQGSAPDTVARALTEETYARFPDDAGMMISPEVARFFTLLTRIMNVRLAVEVGTFTGCSALAIARGLTGDGRLICFDPSREFTDVARRHWAAAGVADRVELRLVAAEEGLRAMPADPVIDLAFIDADKRGYPAYWAELIPRLRPGGLVLVDNVLMRGRVLDPDGHPDAVRAVTEFNAAVLTDDRVETMMLPIGDGITLARRV
jgi:caffeoyl-CoA O-methyltransferase